MIAVTRAATARRPDIARNWEMLARLLLQVDRNDAAIEVLEAASARLPERPDLQLMLADAYRRAGRSDLARTLLGRSGAPSADDPLASLHRKLMTDVEGPDRGGDLALETLARDPTNPEAIAVLGGVARRTGRPQMMVEVCEAALAREPAHTLARYELALAQAKLGRHQEASGLIEFAPFVRLTDVPPPEGFDDADAFEAALIGEIERNPTLRSDPAGKATKGGFQSGALPGSGDRAIAALLTAVRKSVDAFEASLPADGKHPFAMRRPRRARLRAWAVVVGGDGRQVSHIHPDGWLSGVYYVSVPAPDPDDPRRGCLVLGSLAGKSLGVDPPWQTVDVRPARGRLVLFPSYVPHATLPSRSGEPRVCISFDVIPVPPETPANGEGTPDDDGGEHATKQRA